MDNIFHARRSSKLVRRAKHLLGLALTASLLAGCATFSNKPEDIVKQRAQERWTALIAGQFEKAYDYSSPAFRKLVTRDHYRSTFGAAARWEKAEVVDVQCKPDTCTVRVLLTVQVLARGFPKASPEVTETWLFENGQWWLYQKL